MCYLRSAQLKEDESHNRRNDKGLRQAHASQHRLPSVHDQRALVDRAHLSSHNRKDELSRHRSPENNHVPHYLAAILNHVSFPGSTSTKTFSYPSNSWWRVPIAHNEMSRPSSQSKMSYSVLLAVKEPRHKQSPSTGLLVFSTRPSNDGTIKIRRATAGLQASPDDPSWLD